MIAPTWNDEFELPDGFYSVSNIQDYIVYIIEKHESLPVNVQKFFLFMFTSTEKVID